MTQSKPGTLWKRSLLTADPLQHRKMHSTQRGSTRSGFIRVAMGWVIPDDTAGRNIQGAIQRLRFDLIKRFYLKRKKRCLSLRLEKLRKRKNNPPDSHKYSFTLDFTDQSNSLPNGAESFSDQGPPQNRKDRSVFSRPLKIVSRTASRLTALSITPIKDLPRPISNNEMLQQVQQKNAERLKKRAALRQKNHPLAMASRYRSFFLAGMPDQFFVSGGQHEPTTERLDCR